ncbi:MAG: autotransporter domain-containing protein [Rhodobacteraceae bacterium]|nr:MAG: autotransporter domain-containing protein [Paracoccaceae bacterium]
MKHTGFALALAAGTALWAGQAHAQELKLTTTFAGGNGQSGNAFDIRVGGSAITLRALELHLDGTSAQRLNFWFREGSVIGNLGSSVGWTRLDQAVLTGAGSGNPTPWDIADQVFDANTEYAILILSEGSGLDYTNSPSGVGTDAASDANLTIEHGFGVAYNTGDPDGFGGSTFQPRTWNGSIIYVLGGNLGSASDALTATAGTSARLIVIGADGVVRDAGQVSIAARNSQFILTRSEEGTGETNGVISTQGAPGLAGNVYAWAELTGFRSNDFGTGNGTLSGGGLQIGADVGVGPDMVAGLSLGHSQVKSSDAGTTNDGDYTYLQPYFSYRRGAWAGTASLIWGKGSFDQNAGAGTADVELAAVTFEGGYDNALGGNLTLTPTVGLIHGREDTDGTGGTLAGTSSDVTFTQVSLGARLTHATGQGTLFAGLHAEYLNNDTVSVLAQNLLANDGWTGRLELGGETALANGMQLSTSVEVSGLGGDMQTATGAVKIALRF